MIDQAIYGYRDGHRLIATSADIPQTHELTLLGLTDPALESGASEVAHVSGAPLGRDFFAIVKTYSAPEISRPGAVWSHALLIPARLVNDFDWRLDVPGLLQRPAVSVV